MSELRVFVGSKIMQSSKITSLDKNHLFHEDIGSVWVYGEGFYINLTDYLAPDPPLIRNSIIPHIVGFSYYETIKLPRSRKPGVYTSGGCSIVLSSSVPTGANFIIRCKAIGGIEVYKKMYNLYTDVCAGRRWPDPDKDFTANQCRKPILQVRYHLHETVLIIRDRIVAHLRRWFRR